MGKWYQAHCNSPMGKDGTCCCDYCQGYEDGEEQGKAEGRAAERAEAEEWMRKMSADARRDACFDQMRCFDYVLGMFLDSEHSTAGDVLGDLKLVAKAEGRAEGLRHAYEACAGWIRDKQPGNAAASFQVAQAIVERDARVRAETIAAFAALVLREADAREQAGHNRAAEWMRGFAPTVLRHEWGPMTRALLAQRDIAQQAKALGKAADRLQQEEWEEAALSPDDRIGDGSVATLARAREIVLDLRAAALKSGREGS